MRGRSSSTSRVAAVLAAAFLWLAWGTPAAAWNYPLLPHVQGLAFFPERPNDQEPTSAVLSAAYVNECWRLTGQRLVDSAQVEVSLAPGTSCGDSVSSWTASFVLGVLSAGRHELSVRALVSLPDGNLSIEEITVPFDVEHGVPPPPPPPPGGDSLGALVQGLDVQPARPLLGDQVQVRVWGRTPWECALVASAGVSGDTLAVSLGQASPCVDTSRVWTHTFALGAPAVGEHRYELCVTPAGGPWPAVVLPVAFAVTDPNAPPPPPPPPGDSLKAGLSASHPNPFADQTRFGVSVAAPTFAEVAVFDLAGRRVVTLHRGLLPTGTTQLAWDGRRRDGSRAPGGIYFYRLTLPDRVVNRRVVLLGTP